MNYNSFIKTLTRYSVARIPFITLNSIEQTRVLEAIKTVSKDLCLPFYVHSLSKGMIDISTNRIINDDRSVMGALDFISEQIKLRQNLTFVLTEVSDIESDSLTSRYFLSVVALAEENGASIIVITSNPVWNQLQRLGMSIQLDLPNEQEMLSIIYKTIEPYRNDIVIEWNSDDYKEAANILAGISRIEAQNVITSLIATRRISTQALTELKFAKDKLFSNISGLEKIDVLEDVLSIGGLDGLKKWLYEKKKLLSPQKREEMLKRGLHPPKGILLVGVPGCGKSLSAKAIASMWNLPLYRLDFATVQGQYVGQSEKQLKEAFLTAEHVSPCILWIDEIEKGLASIGNDSSGVTTRMVGQFLFWLQECKKNVFVVATANDVSMLPSELLRRGRFDELFFIDLPSDEERREILDLYIEKYLETSINNNIMDKLVKITEGFTGADIESSIRDIAYRVLVNDDLKIDGQLLTESLLNVIPLSKTSPDKIDAIRDWGKEKAVPASGRPIGSVSLNKNVDTKNIRIVLV